MTKQFHYVQEVATFLANDFGESQDHELLRENLTDTIQMLSAGDSAVCAYAGRKFQFTYVGPNDYLLEWVGGKTFMNVLNIKRA